MTTNTASLPETMKAIEYSTYGEPSSILTLNPAHPVPTPSANEILIRVHAAAMNGIDHKLAKGELQLIFRRTLPIVPGLDLSGVVVAVGAGCTRLKVGDEVYADSFIKNGAFAEYAAVEESMAALKPPHISFAEAACLPVTATTAYNALLKAGLSAGQKLVILGGGGGVGSFAIQIAKRSFGASQVAVTCSQRNVDYVKSLGADTVIDYNTQSYGTALTGQNFDVVLDCVGGYKNFEDSKAVLKSGGTFITLIGDEQTGAVTVFRLVSMISSILVRSVYSLVGAAPTYIYFTLDATNTSSDLDKITVMVDKGQIKLNGIIEKVYQFDLQSVRDMFAQNEKGHVRGKLVLQIVSTPSSRS